MFIRAQDHTQKKERTNEKKNRATRETEREREMKKSGEGKWPDLEARTSETAARGRLLGAGSWRRAAARRWLKPVDHGR